MSMVKALRYDKVSWHAQKMKWRDSLSMALDAGQPWLIYQMFPNMYNKRDVMRLHRRLLLSDIFSLLPSQHDDDGQNKKSWFDTEQGPKTDFYWQGKKLKISVSYARDFCVIGLHALSDVHSGFGIDVVDTMAILNWPEEELDVLAQTYLSSETQQALQNEYGSAKVELFATAWTHFEAVAKANEKNGIVQEDIHLTQTVHTWNITNLPAGIVGCAVVV